MHFIKKRTLIITIGLCISFTLLSSQAHRNLNLILIVDTNGDDVGGVLSNDLAVAIKQKVAPIIVSENVLYNFFALRASLTPEAVKELKDSILANKQRIKELGQEMGKQNMGAIIDEAERQYTQQVEREKKRFDQISPLLLAYSNKFLVYSDKFTYSTPSIEDIHAIRTLITDYQKTLQELRSYMAPDSHAAQALHAVYADFTPGHYDPLAIGRNIDLMIKEMLADIQNIDALTIEYEATHEFKEATAIHEKRMGLQNNVLRNVKYLGNHTLQVNYAAMDDYKAGVLAADLASRKILARETQMAQEQELAFLDLRIAKLKNAEKEAALFYHGASFTVNDWHLYKHVHAPIYLLIPKTYATRTEKEWAQYHVSATEQETKEYTPRERALGLTVDHAAIMQPLPATIADAEHLLKFIFDNLSTKAGLDALFADESAPFQLPALQQCFVLGRQADRGFWNIFMSGHGFYQKKSNEVVRKEAREKEQKAKLVLAKLLKEAVQSLPATGETVAEKDNVLFRREMNKLFIAYLLMSNENIFDPQEEMATAFLHDILRGNALIEQLIRNHQIEPIVQNKLLLRNYLAMLQKGVEQEISEMRTAESLTEPAKENSSSIAGLSLEQFKDLLNFLNRKVKTSFMYYTTCFGGGFNAKQVRLYLQQLETTEKKALDDMSSSFIVAAGSLTDDVVAGFNIYGELIPLNFVGFFNDLQQFFLRDSTFKKDPISTILKNVSIRNRGKSDEKYLHGISDIPLVYIPGAGIMHAQEVDEEIMVLTNVKLKALELVIPKKKAAVEAIKTAGKSGLLFYPTDIKAPVIIGVDSKGQPTALVPMTVDPSTYTFNTIDASAIPFNTFLRKSIMDVRSVMPRTFVIQELRCTNYKDSGLPGSEGAVLILRNVIIRSTITSVLYGENIQWDISFTVVGAGKEVAFNGTMLDSYSDPKKGTGRSISMPVWKQVSSTEHKEEKERKSI